MATLTIPNEIQSGDTLSAADMNANFDAVAASVNSVVNAQLNAAAAIGNAKLAKPQAIYPLNVSVASIASAVETAVAHWQLYNSAQIVEIMVSAADDNDTADLLLDVDYSTDSGSNWTNVLTADHLTLEHSNGPGLITTTALDVTAMPDNAWLRASISCATGTFNNISAAIWLKATHV